MASCSCSPGPLSLGLIIISAHVVMQTATGRGCFHSELVPFLPDGGDQMLHGEGERTRMQGSVSPPASPCWQLCPGAAADVLGAGRCWMWPRCAHLGWAAPALSLHEQSSPAWVLGSSCGSLAKWPRTLRLRPALFHAPRTKIGRSDSLCSAPEIPLGSSVVVRGADASACPVLCSCRRLR